MKFIKNYKDNDVLRKSFAELAKNTFGIDFQAWYSNGYWNDSYVCYSYVDMDRVVSNVSINKMHLTWEGKSYKAIQIGTVMTDSEYRKQGLAYKLLEKVMTDFEDKVDFIYLFGNDSALNMYKKFDMHEFKEHSYFSEMPTLNKIKFRKLDLGIDSDLDIMKLLTSKRVSQSDGIGVNRDSHLVMFYCYKTYADCLYFCDELNAIVVMEESNDVLHIYDVISENLLEIDDVIKSLPVKVAKKVEYHFKPRNIDVIEKELIAEDQTLLIKHRGLEPKESFRFSAFSHA